MQWAPVDFLGGVDETDNVISNQLQPDDIKLDASALKFLNDNNVNHAKKDLGLSNVQAHKIDSIGVAQLKSNEKEAFIAKHRQNAQGVAAMAYELPLPNKNFKQGGDFMGKGLFNSNSKVMLL